MIYHFCNMAFGRNFQALAATYAREHAVKITTVMTRAPKHEHGFDHALIVADVNAPSFLKRIGPGDHGIVTGFNQIFTLGTIERFASLVNIHASLLPYYRGPSPAHWCIAHGERATGFTLHTITPKIDAGPILYQDEVPIDGELRAEALTTRIAAAAGPIFVRYLEHLRSGEPWEARVVDAASVYTAPVAYRSFAPTDR
jgi:methionyl-tRNA formyltransferase